MFRKKDISVKDLETELNMAGVFAFHDYQSMGHSGDKWREFRLGVAHELLKRLNISKRPTKDAGRE